MEKHLPLPKAAAMAGVGCATLKRWLREAGYNMPPRQSAGRYTILVPERMWQRVVEMRSPRLARS